MEKIRLLTTKSSQKEESTALGTIIMYDTGKTILFSSNLKNEK